MAYIHRFISHLADFSWEAWECFGEAWGGFGRLGEGLGNAWVTLREVWGGLGRLGNASGRLWEAWGGLGKAWGMLGECFGKAWGGLGNVWECFWEAWGGLGRLGEGFGGCFGEASERKLGTDREKHWKMRAKQPLQRFCNDVNPLPRPRTCPRPKKNIGKCGQNYHFNGSVVMSNRAPARARARAPLGSVRKH